MCHVEMKVSTIDLDDSRTGGMSESLHQMYLGGTADSDRSVHVR